MPQATNSNPVATSDRSERMRLHDARGDRSLRQETNKAANTSDGKLDLLSRPIPNHPLDLSQPAAGHFPHTVHLHSEDPLALNLPSFRAFSYSPSFYYSLIVTFPFLHLSPHSNIPRPFACGLLPFLLLFLSGCASRNLLGLSPIW